MKKAALITEVAYGEINRRLRCQAEDLLKKLDPLFEPSPLLLDASDLHNFPRRRMSDLQQLDKGKLQRFTLAFATIDSFHL